MVYIEADELPELPEDEYYHHELIGLQVEDESGQELGVLEQVLVTGANDVYVVVKNSGKEIMIPAVAEFIKNINIDVKKIFLTEACRTLDEN